MWEKHVWSFWCKLLNMVRYELWLFTHFVMKWMINWYEMSGTNILNVSGTYMSTFHTFPQIESKWAENTIVMIWVSLILQQCELIRYEYPKNKLLWNEWNTHFECEWYYMSNFRIYPQIDSKWVKKYSYCIFWCKMSNSYWTKWAV